MYDMLEHLIPHAKLSMERKYLQTAIRSGNARYSYHEGEILVDDSVNAAYGIYNHHDKDTVNVIYPIKVKKRITTMRPHQDHQIEIIPMVQKANDFEPLTKAGG